MDRHSSVSGGWERAFADFPTGSAATQQLAKAQRQAYQAYAYVSRTSPYTNTAVTTIFLSNLTSGPAPLYIQLDEYCKVVFHVEPY